MATSTVTLFVLLENLEPATPRNLHIRTSEKNLQYHCCSRSPGTLEGESGLRVSLVRVFRAFLHRLQEIATSSHHPRGLCNIARPLGMICNCTGTLGEIMVAFFLIDVVVGVCNIVQTLEKTLDCHCSLVNLQHHWFS